jgi:hypothetical protein
MWGMYAIKFVANRWEETPATNPDHPRSGIVIIVIFEFEPSFEFKSRFGPPKCELLLAAAASHPSDAAIKTRDRPSYF